MIKNNAEKLISVLIITLILSGCAETNTSPSCKKVGGKGVGCVSMDTAYGLSKQGYFNRGNPEPDGSIRSSNDDDANTSDPTNSSLYINKTDVNWQPSVGQPLRYGETVQVIWIAPYVDSQGDYYYPHQVSTVIRNGYWVGEPQSAINLSGDN